MSVRYAWGVEASGSCRCPAAAAGFSMSDTNTRRAAEMYDKYASHYDITGKWPDEGLVTEHDARLAWGSVLETINERLEAGHNELDWMHTAALIYRELGWEDYHD